MKKFLFGMVALLCLCASSAQAETIRVLLSTSSTDALAGSNLQLANVGDIGTLYIWGSTNGTGTRINGFSIDLLSSDPSVLQATDHDIENPLIGGFAPRWNGTGAGTLGDLIDDSLSVAVTSPGFFTNDLDTYALYSTVTFQATGNGLTNLTFAEGSNPFTVVGQGGQIGNVLFGGGSVLVGTAIPEPGSFAVLGLAGLGLAGYRRIRRKA